jgi:hypothetical protein
MSPLHLFWTQINPNSDVIHSHPTWLLEGKSNGILMFTKYNMKNKAPDKIYSI